MINVDAHILLYGFTGDLRPRERALLAANPWSIAATALWEIVSLARLERVSVDLDDREFRSYLNRVAGPPGRGSPEPAGLPGRSGR